jgi:glycosyltransferase involved in cell wall biosynthesis
MKIITAMYTLKKGGSYDRFKMMIEAFLEEQCEVHCLSLTPIQIKNPFYHNEVAGFPFKLGNGWVAKLIVLFLFPLYSLWIGWREKINLFVAFGSIYAFILAIPKWILKKPMVTFIRGDSVYGLEVRDSRKYFLWLNQWIEYLGLFFSDRIITVNTAIQKEITRVIGIGKKKKIDVEVLFNDVPPIPISLQEEMFRTRTQFAIPEGAKVLLTAGIINKGKNIEILIKCLPKIGMNNLFLLVVGEGSKKVDFRYKIVLKELARKLGLEEKVIFTGWLKKEELWRIFYAGDLFILPSRSEGMPNAMLEALGTDLPCLGSNIPGIEDILHYEELMFHPLDEEALASKIRQLFCDDQYFQKIKGLCQERKRAFLFDWKERMFQAVTRGMLS